ncbi:MULTISPECIES: TusE/DsrC/DsvC family sulfur relay protein [Gammaproteobacteria]|uniref:TusE/DsrC/DsvC family sulfur relay protein n=1 Tax=Gammaproteobacteria TaxID=1236 RepID=UPI000DD07898|nr:MULTISPECIES: TusE/DsrC/DsvC family sulfur relay protein [Gammaproteobacteria]RTE87183.1 TusE/DsrC/DsvC family sulfur relay protein [Aliidiomarina sp. B3213]TCZ93029.1 TusE/DsrC/DsvC family sulfur relay protein [Lysobacter sp. N42]
MFEVNGSTYETDKHEYLLHFEQWNETLAEHIATLENIELSPEHWEVVNFVREFYQEYDTSPAMRVLVKAVAKKLGEDKGNSRYLYSLFPKGPAKQATRIAGLPKPAKCI